VAVRTRNYGAASVVMTIATIIALFIIAGIVLVLVGANMNNDIVDFVMDIGRFFARPFGDLIPQDNQRANYVVNWGIAAIVYLIVGSIIARLIRRA
jgi:uncharacterized protein YggT (Ycf19 family)